MSDPLSHCLYPSFTQRLLRELEHGRSINLVGHHANGAKRLLDDLTKAVPSGITPLRVNLHDMRQSYSALIDGLWQQAKAHGITRPDHATPADLASWCDSLTSEAKVWLLLERFDTLLDDPERAPRYHCGFFRDELNSLRNRTQLVLITHSAKPHRSYSVLCASGEPPLSPPDLQVEPLPTLREPEALAEVRRRLPGLEAEVQLQLVTAALHGKGGYQLLDHFMRKWEQGADGEQRLPQRLKRWQREADDILPALNLGNLNRLRRWLKQWLRQLAHFLTDLIGEISALRKAVELWRRWRGKEKREERGKVDEEGSA